MTKADIVNEISRTTGIEKAAVQTTVEAFMEAIKGSVIDGKNVYLRGFGSFVVKKRAEKTARNISKNVRQYHLFSVLIAIFSGITGLIISYYLNTVTGATIVLVSSVIFFITLIIRRKFV